MKKKLNHLKTFFSKPYNVLLLIFLVVLAYLVVVPLFSIVKDTFIVHSAEKSRVRQAVGSFTLYHWNRLFVSQYSNSLLYEPLMHSLICAVFSCIVSVLIGGGFAWLVTRTDMRWKKVMTKLFIFPYIMPSWTLALAWKNFFKNTAVGGAMGIFTAATGIETANWFAYGAFPIILVTGLHYAPFAYILIGGVLRNMDANLEEAAVILKTNRLRMFARITIPMVMPAVMSTIILVFSSAMSSFAVPQFLGLPVRYYVLTTELYAALQGTNPGVGYIIAILMIIISVLIMIGNQLLIGKRKSYATVTGKSANVSVFHLKKARNIISLLAGVVVLCMSVIPMISFMLQSVIIVKGDYSLANMTLDFWIGISKGGNDIMDKAGILINSDVWKTLFNSIKLSAIVAVGAGTFGFLAGYSIVRRRGSKLSRIVENLTFIPYLIPSMAFAAIYLSMFSQSHGIIPSLYGTFAILALIGTVKYLPMASRSGVNSMLQLSPEIEEAGIIQGIPWIKRMTRIIVPIEKSTIVSGYLLPFVSSMRELSLYVILVTANNRVLTTLLFMYDEKGWDQYSNAINLLIIFVVLLVNFGVEKLTGASIEKGVGGSN
ncbi:iron ABC transporter permease [uncultured Traorella sp.]|uniref:ABC transporter permease n=1 Tax=uncultured Traorella sp. TaxID=1929048 RepID=UPI0025D425A1|nr:iron ABC transporter permease [uncultured Traorella sp.]